MKVLFWIFIGLDKHETSEHLLTAVIEQLCEAGHSVHILQKDTGGDLPAIPERLSKYKITTDTVPFKAAPKGNFVKRYFAELKYIKCCKKYITSGYDAVFIQSTTVGGFAVRAIRKKLKNTIITFNVQDIFPYNAAYSGSIKKNKLVFKVMAALQRYGYKHADHVITISEDMKETLVADGTPADKIEVIYNWSYQNEPYDKVKLDMTVPNKLFNKNFFNVVYAGNIGVMQNVDILIEAAALMKEQTDVWFHIIGNGAYKEKLQKKAKELGIVNISFWPMQPPEGAPSIYAAADVNVIPLVKDVYRTALPSKTATCLACGRPIIFAIGKASKFGRMVQEEAGCVVVDSDNPEKLAIAIRATRTATTDKYFSFFASKMCRDNNAKKYAQIIGRHL